MYFQFLIEDQSAGVLVNHVMEKFQIQYENVDIIWNIRTFTGIGNLRKGGNIIEQKTGKLLNDLPMYMRGFDKSLRNMDRAAIVVVLDNDKRDIERFRTELEGVAGSNMILCDYVFCIAIKELESWLLGDVDAIVEAYPNAKTQYLGRYEQDGICDTWEVLADIVYPRGLAALRKKAGSSYFEIGKAKCEWADQIGRYLHLHQNASPSYNYFIGELERRILA